MLTPRAAPAPLLEAEPWINSFKLFSKSDGPCIGTNLIISFVMFCIFSYGVSSNSGCATAPALPIEFCSSKFTVRMADILRFKSLLPCFLRLDNAILVTLFCKSEKGEWIKVPDSYCFGEENLGLLSSLIMSLT